MEGFVTSSSSALIPRSAFFGTQKSSISLFPTLPKTPTTTKMSVISPSITLDRLTPQSAPAVPTSVTDKTITVNQIYQQVFGNAYIMESERAEMYMAESMYRRGAISAREFIRSCALSSTYRRRFFECCGPYRSVELNFKHLLGRGPKTQQEISEHVQRMNGQGWQADVNSFIDSEEYDMKFGEDYVPGMVFKGTYSPIEEFNRMCGCYSAPGTSDKSLTGRGRVMGIENGNFVLSLDGAGIPSKFVSTVAGNGKTSFVSIARALPKRPDLDRQDRNTGFVAEMTRTAQVINENAAPKKRYEVSMGNYMYLTQEEAKEYSQSNDQEQKTNSMVVFEIKQTEQQIADLENRLTELQTAAA